MTPGPTQILRAPGCQQLVKNSTVGSGNTFGARFWTDGKMDAPMLPDRPWLMKHPTEGVLFWMDEAKEVGEIDSFTEESGEHPEWIALEHVETPDEDDYRKAVRSGIANTTEKLRYVRMRLWWCGNDAIRGSDEGALPDEHLDNLQEFAKLLPEDEADGRLMKAEAYRELGMFEESKQLLNFDFPEEMSFTRSSIRNLVEKGETKVQSVEEAG
jgi:hypothetical protein